MKQFLTAIALLMQLLITYGQDRGSHKLVVTLENAPFNSLFLFDYTEDRGVLISPQRKDKFTWQFDIADSIAFNSDRMRLLVNRYDSLTNSEIIISFVHKSGDNETIVGNVGVDDSVNHIYGRYKDRKVYEDEAIVTKINGIDSLVFGDLVVERFDLVEEQSSNDIRVRASEPFFAWFMSANGAEKTYEDYLTGYIEVSKQYPDSRYLMTYLADNLGKFRSAEDIHLIYDNLSEKYRQSFWNAKIERFLRKRFDNMALLNYTTDKPEYIVLDSSKYNLIIFTAYYCQPCIEEIPVLKEIHKELKDKVNFVYVSIDRASDIHKFEKLLDDHTIPWRTVYATDQATTVQDTYYIEGIPHNVLVSPKGDMEILDVRKKTDRERLYQQVNSVN